MYIPDEIFPAVSKKLIKKIPGALKVPVHLVSSRIGHHPPPLVFLIQRYIYVWKGYGPCNGRVLGVIKRFE